MDESLDVNSTAEREAVSTTLATIAADTKSWDKPADVIKRVGTKMGWYQLVDSLRTAPTQFWGDPSKLRLIAGIFNVAAELGDRARTIPFEVGDLAHILGTLCDARATEFEYPSGPQSRPRVPVIPQRDDLLKQVFEAFMRQLNLAQLGWGPGVLPLKVETVTLRSPTLWLGKELGVEPLYDIVGSFRTLLPVGGAASGLRLSTPDGAKEVGWVDSDGVVRVVDAQLQVAIEIMAATDNGRRYVLDPHTIAQAVRIMLKAAETVRASGPSKDTFFNFWQKQMRTAWGAADYCPDPGKRLSLSGDGYLAASAVCWKIATGKDAPDITT